MAPNWFMESEDGLLLVT